MKSSLLLAVPAVCLTLVFAGCQTDSHPTHPPKPGPTGATPTPSPTPVLGVTPTPSPSPSPAPGEAAPTPTPAPTTSGEIPYGVPVPGKPGFVMSPFSPAGYVDVRGFPPNTEVKCPYSGKIFRVP